MSSEKEAALGLPQLSLKLLVDSSSWNVNVTFLRKLSVKMKNAQLLAYYRSCSFNLTLIINHQGHKSFTSATQSA